MCDEMIPKVWDWKREENGNSQWKLKWEWEKWLNLGTAIGMGQNNWKLEEMGLKKTFRSSPATTRGCSCGLVLVGEKKTHLLSHPGDVKWALV